MRKQHITAKYIETDSSLEITAWFTFSRPLLKLCDCWFCFETLNCHSAWNGIKSHKNFNIVATLCERVSCDTCLDEFFLFIILMEYVDGQAWQNVKTNKLNKSCLVRLSRGGYTQNMRYYLTRTTEKYSHGEFGFHLFWHVKYKLKSTVIWASCCALLKTRQCSDSSVLQNSRKRESAQSERNGNFNHLHFSKKCEERKVDKGHDYLLIIFVVQESSLSMKNFPFRLIELIHMLAVTIFFGRQHVVVA